MYKKICYILPEYREGDATHFSYIGRLLKEVSKKGGLDIFLLIEKGEMPKDNFGCKKIKVINAPNFLTRAIKTKWWIWQVWLSGYKDFYVHYSFFSATVASCITRCFSGRAFYWNCGEPWKYKRNFFREKFERLTYHLITFLVTGSESLAEQYSDYYRIQREKIKVMPNWIDMERFSEPVDIKATKRWLSLPLDKKIILFVHRLSPRKGSRLILPVLRGLLKKREDVFMVVVGTGPDEKMLAVEIKNDLAISDDMIRLIGTVPNTEIQKYFAVADIFFMPSEEEGFSRSLLEAMASGTSIVASDVGSTKEIMPKEAQEYVLPSGDIEGLAEKIDKLLSLSMEEKFTLSNLLKSEAGKYNTPIVAQKFVELFK